MHRHIFLLFIFFAISFSPAMGQMSSDASFKERRANAAKSLQEINEGVLIVRLTSNSRKIASMQKLKKSKGLDKKKRQRLAKDIKEIKTDTRQENELLMEAFLSEYNFSEIMFVYDTSAHLLSENIQSGYFLNKNLELDTSINLKNRSFYIVRFGYPTSSGQKRIKGLVVMDENFKDMVPPFPYKFFLPPSQKSIEKKEKRAEKLSDIKALVKGLNSDFQQYFAKSKYKGWLKE